MKIIYLAILILGTSVALPSSIYPELEEPLAKRLIKVGPSEFRIIDEKDKSVLRKQNINFMDITKLISIDDAERQGLVKKPHTSWWTKLLLLLAKQISYMKKIPEYNYPKLPRHKEEIKPLFKKIDSDKMFKSLSKLTSFYTRYYKSQSGFESANWLYGTLEKIIEPLGNAALIVKVKHVGWDQYSIIVSIFGELNDKVVVGAHQDSANLILPNLLKSPGADDDGSGTVTILEALRVLAGEAVKERFKPKNTLEFHFYSAEEGGLLGSMDIFKNYSESNAVVLGMLQQDMTGFTAKTTNEGEEPHLGVITDYTFSKLNDFLKLIIDSYLSIPYHETSCGYACSDHSSALENGFPSSFVIESEFKYTNGFIHSVLDTIDRLDWDHMVEHVKLTIAYAYELSFATDLY